MHTYIHAYIHTYMCVCTYEACACANVYSLHMYVCMYICLCIPSPPLDVYIHIYIDV